MNAPLPKIKAILLYFCSNTNKIFLGKTKLMKLFYFLDFMHVKQYGRPVTFDKYVKLEHGPIPSFIKNMVDNVSDDPENSILSDTISIKRMQGMNMHQVIGIKKFTKHDEKYFSNSELDILEKVCTRFANENTKTIVDTAHSEAPWKKTNILEEIPYSLAAEDKDCLMDEEELNLLNQII